MGTQRLNTRSILSRTRVSYSFHPFIMAPTAVDSTTSPVVPEVSAKRVPLRAIRSKRKAATNAATATAAELGSASDSSFAESTASGVSRAKDSYTFRLPESAVDEGHMLWFRSATLGLDAVEKERNVVEIRCLDREGKEQRLQLCALTLGRQETCKLDLAMTWTLDREVTLKLVKGSGPVSVVGTHVTEAVELEDGVDSEFVPGESSADDTGMETKGDDVDATEIDDLKKDAEANKNVK